MQSKKIFLLIINIYYNEKLLKKGALDDSQLKDFIFRIVLTQL